MLGIDLSWMEWTTETLVIFAGVIVMLSVMTVWDIRSPSTVRKGFLPFGFTRGERLFLSIVTTLGTVILWMAFLPDMNWLYAFPVAAVLVFILVRWG